MALALATEHVRESGVLDEISRCVSVSLNSTVTYEKVGTGWSLVHRGVASVGRVVGRGTVHS